MALATSPETTLAERITQVEARVGQACAAAGRARHDVQLLAVSKYHSVDAMRAAYALGLRDFGENYVQELLGKAPALADLPDIRLRFIGRLQRNKVKHLLGASRPVHSVDSVDSLALATALSKGAERAQSPVQVLIQVNLGDEEQKAGVAPEALGRLVDHVSKLPSLTLRGLMAIPPVTGGAGDARAHFRRLRSLVDDHGLVECSMGMSGDLEVAIEEGATMVRVGTAIFGPRPPRPA